MPHSKINAERCSEKSLPENSEEGIVGMPNETVTDLQDKFIPIVATSGDRTLVLMDLDNGMVGWESADDPDNPQ